MTITIIYDNNTFKKGLNEDWGFACFIEVYGKRILFDTGANGAILLDNMKKLNIDPKTVDEIFISHDHRDHTGGLSDFLKINPVKVYIPASCHQPQGAKEIIRVKESLKIHEGIFSTGELKNIEQSLVITTEKGAVVIVGCSHSGVENILKAVKQFGNPIALIGGLHGFSNLDIVKDLDLICATHCTQQKTKIMLRYPDTYAYGGAGKVIEI